MYYTFPINGQFYFIDDYSQILRREFSVYKFYFTIFQNSSVIA